MVHDTLTKANVLWSNIQKCNRLMNCFEWDEGESTNPKIIIEYDDNDEGRSQEEAPFPLNDEIINVLKEFITNKRDELQKEFDKL